MMNMPALPFSQGSNISLWTQPDKGLICLLFKKIERISVSEWQLYVQEDLSLYD